MTEQERIKLLAVEVMEWRLDYESRDGFFWTERGMPYDVNVDEYEAYWNPFRYIEHAWMLIEKLEDRYEVEIGSHLGDNAWYCLFIPEEGLSLPWLYGEAEDVRVAISEAALETIRGD